MRPQETHQVDESSPRSAPIELSPSSGAGERHQVNLQPSTSRIVLEQRKFIEVLPSKLTSNSPTSATSRSSPNEQELRDVCRPKHDDTHEARFFKEHADWFWVQGQEEDPAEHDRLVSATTRLTESCRRT